MTNLIKYTYKEAFVKIVILAQCFALMPISNATSGDAKKLRFKQNTCIYFYSVLVTALIALNLLLFQMNGFYIDLNFSYFVTLFFFTCGLTTAILFIKLAKSWPQVMHRWRQVDESMDKSYGFPKNLNKIATITAIVIIGLAAVEHALFLNFNIYHTKSSSRGDVYIEEFLKSNFSHVFRFIPYHVTIGIVCELVNISCTFSWNYMDLFITVISIGLSSRMSQIGKRIQTICFADDNRKYKKTEWKEIREDFTRLYNLTQLVDRNLAWLIVLSFLNNLFIILVQLVHSVEPNKEGTVTERLYFAYSFGFLIARTLVVCLTASNIYSKSIEPIWMINLLPHEAFNDELDRLLMQLNCNPCCLTGWGLFRIKHSLLLDVIGAIVSYELIFIQFRFVNYQDS